RYTRRGHHHQRTRRHDRETDDDRVLVTRAFDQEGRGHPHHRIGDEPHALDQRGLGIVELEHAPQVRQQRVVDDGDEAPHEEQAGEQGQRRPIARAAAAVLERRWRARWSDRHTLSPKISRRRDQRLRYAFLSEYWTPCEASMGRRQGADDDRSRRSESWDCPEEQGVPGAVTSERPRPGRLRSRAWFDNPENIDMTALYLERYLNFGLSLAELRGGKPIIGIAQTGSDLSPCNRHHLVLAERVREGIREAGGIALEFPVHPIQETGKRPTAGLDRNLAYLALVELLHGYPIDGVVLTTGCDKTTPACLMAAATVNIPAIALSVGPMLNGWHKGRRTG